MRAFTVTVVVALPMPPSLSVAESFAANVPGAANVCKAVNAVTGAVPSPKFHDGASPAAWSAALGSVAEPLNDSGWPQNTDSDAGAVTWTVNGRQGSPLGPDGAIRNLVITPENVATIK